MPKLAVVTSFKFLFVLREVGTIEFSEKHKEQFIIKRLSAENRKLGTDFWYSR